MSVNSKATEAFESSRVSPPIRMPYECDVSGCPVNYRARLRECLAERKNELGCKEYSYAIYKMVRLLEANHRTGAISFSAVVEFLIYVSYAKRKGLVGGLVRSGLNPMHDNSWIKKEMIEERLDQARDAFLEWLDMHPEFEEVPVDEVQVVLQAFTDKCGADLARNVLSRFHAENLSDVKPAHRTALISELDAEELKWILS